MSATVKREIFAVYIQNRLHIAISDPRQKCFQKELFKRLILKGKHTKGETHMCKLSSCDFTVNHVK